MKQLCAFILATFTTAACVFGTAAFAVDVEKMSTIEDVTGAAPDFLALYQNIKDCGGKTTIFKLDLSVAAAAMKPAYYLRLDSLPEKVCEGGKTVFLADQTFLGRIRRAVQSGAPILLSNLVHPNKGLRAAVLNLSGTEAVAAARAMFPRTNPKYIMFITPILDLSGFMHEFEHVAQFQDGHPVYRVSEVIESVFPSAAEAEAVKKALREVFAYKAQRDFLKSFYADRSYAFQMKLDLKKYAMATRTADGQMVEGSTVGAVLKVDGMSYASDERDMLEAVGVQYVQELRVALRALKDNDKKAHCRVLQAFKDSFNLEEQAYLRSQLMTSITNESCSVVLGGAGSEESGNG